MSYKVYYGQISSISSVSDSSYQWSSRELIYDTSNADGDYLGDPILTLEANEAGSFEADIPKSNQIWNDIVLFRGIIEIEEDGEVIWQGRITQIDQDFNLNKHIYCEGDLSFLNDIYHIIDWDSMQGLSMSTGTWCYYPFNYFMEYCHSKYISDGKGIITSIGEDLIPEEYYLQELAVAAAVEASTSDSSITVDDTIHKSAWDSLKNDYLGGMLSKYDGYAYVYLRHELTSNGYKRVLYPVFMDSEGIAYGRGWIKETSQTIEFGKNLLDITIENGIDGDFVNAITAYGYTTSGWWIFKKTDPISAYANDAVSISKYGTVSKIIYLDGTDNTTDSLQQAAEDALNAIGSGEEYQTIEVKAVDLYDAGEATDRLGFMKMTRIISEPHGIDAWFLCTKATIPLDRPTEKEFVFGKVKKKLSSTQSSINSVSDKGYSMSKSVVNYLNSTESS